MEKNTIVLDELGNEIGFTYPKRARGLVKNGRAEYVDDCTIRFRDTHASTVIDQNIMEDKSMSKVICFNAREFKFDQTDKGQNVGSRMFITDMQGDNVEVYEIGDGKSWTQICTEKVLDKNTEYVFRFAMTRSCNDPYDGVSQFVIMPIAGEQATDEDWENRYVYNLAQSQYKPTICKRWGNTAIRVYEIPFQTSEITKYRFVFVENNSITRICPAKEIEAYSEFADYNYNGWFNEKKEQFEKFKSKDFNVDQTMREVGDTVKNVVDKFAKTVMSAANEVKNQKADEAEAEKEAKNINLSGENFDGNKLAEVLSSIGDGSNVTVSNCKIQDAPNAIDCGLQVEGVNFTACNADIGGNAFYGFVQKIGDGCNLDFSRCSIGRVNNDAALVRSGADGCNIQLAGSNMSASAFATLMSVLGDACRVEMQNANVYEDGTDLDFGESVDAVKIDISNATLPEGIYNRLKAKLGDGCEIVGL